MNVWVEGRCNECTLQRVQSGPGEGAPDATLSPTSALSYLTAIPPPVTALDQAPAPPRFGAHKLVPRHGCGPSPLPVPCWVARVHSGPLSAASLAGPPAMTSRPSAMHLLLPLTPPWPSPSPPCLCSPLPPQLRAKTWVWAAPPPHVLCVRSTLGKTKWLGRLGSRFSVFKEVTKRQRCVRRGGGGRGGRRRLVPKWRGGEGEKRESGWRSTVSSVDEKLKMAVLQQVVGAPHCLYTL